MPRKRPKSISVTKLDAACRQIHAAIALWAYNGDPVAIHTLTAAALRIVLDLSEHAGATTMLFDMDYVQKGREKEYKRWIRKAETFFKHAKDDPNETLEFYPDATELYLFDAIQGYERLSRKRHPSMILFSFRFFLVHGHPLPDCLAPFLKEETSIKSLRILPRDKFFEKFLPELEILARK